MKKIFLILIVILAMQLFAADAIPVPYTKIQFFDNAGLPCAGCLLYSYSAGTSSPLATYVDSGGVTQNTNPVVLDLAGRGAIYLGNNSYKLVLQSPDTAITFWTQDGINNYLLLSRSNTWSGANTFNGAVTISNFNVPGTASFTTVGTFSGQSDPFLFNTNSLNFAAEQAAVDSVSTDGLAAGVLIPSNSTQPIVDAISGIVQNPSGTTTAGVGVNGQCRVTSGIIGTRCWGGTFKSANKVGATASAVLYGVEADWVPNIAGDGGAGFLAVNNTQSLSGFSGGTAFLAGSGTPADSKWAYVVGSNNAEATEFANIGATCTSGSCSSQDVAFRYFTTGTPHVVTVEVDSTGKLNTPPIIVGPGAAMNSSGVGGTMASADTSQAFTAIQEFTANRVALTADWTCGTSGTVTDCSTAKIIGSGGGVPLTFTLPLVAQSYRLTCDLVVGQATAATANNWNLLTATNGATNVTAFFDMYTAATAKAAGVTTDQTTTTTTFNIGGTWTLGGTVTKMPVHIWAEIEGASASGTVLSLQLVAPTAGDVVTIYRGSSCQIQ